MIAPLLTTLSLTALAAAEANPPPLLWYRQPATAWTEALPVGNGRLGAMVFGGLAGERLQLNEDSLWSGGPQDADNPEALAALPEVRRLLFAGRYAEAQQLAAERMVCRGAGSGHGNGAAVAYGSYQTLGDLLLDFPAFTNLICLICDWEKRKLHNIFHFWPPQNVAANTRNQALNALVFLYKQVLYMELGIFQIFCKKESR